MNRRSLWSAPALALVLAFSLQASPVMAAATPAELAVQDALAAIDNGRLDAALDATKKALAADPKLVEAHLLYIRLMIDTGKRTQVQQEYAQRKNQDNVALLLYGRTLEKPEQMEQVFNQVLAKDPKQAWAYYCLANLRVQQNKVDEATKMLQKSVEVQPGFVTGMESLATVYLSTGKIDQAITMLEKVVTLEPDNAKALFELGSLVSAKGDQARAAAYLERSLKLVPDNASVQSNLAFVYLKLKKYDQSLALYDKVLKAEPNDPGARLNREVVRRVKSGNVKYEAVSAMEKAMEAKNPDEAMAQYRRVIEMSPQFELPYMALGQLLAASKKPQEAERAFAKAVELNPSSVEAARMLAEFYLVGGAPAKAEPHLLKAIKLSPNSPELHAALAATYAGMNRLDKAEASYTTAINLLKAPLNVAMRHDRAQVMMARGKFPQAATELQSVLKTAPAMVEARITLGMCYFAMEQFDKAREQYKVVLKAAPKDKQLLALIKANDDRQAEFKTKSKDHMRARQILVKTQPEADAILKSLKAGVSFEQLAMEKSTGPEASMAGDLGFFKKGELKPELENAVAALKVGETSGVVKSAAGFHIIKRLN